MNFLFLARFVFVTAVCSGIALPTSLWASCCCSDLHRANCACGPTEGTADSDSLPAGCCCGQTSDVADDDSAACGIHDNVSSCGGHCQCGLPAQPVFVALRMSPTADELECGVLQTTGELQLTHVPSCSQLVTTTQKWQTPHNRRLSQLEVWRK